MEPISEKQLLDQIEKLKSDRDQLDDDIQTAEKFLSMWRRNQRAQPASSPDPAPLANALKVESANNGNGYGSLAKHVRIAILDCPESYNIDDVMGSLKKIPDVEYGRDNVNQALSRLARMGEITIQTKGAGKRPTVFMKRRPGETAP